MDKIDIMAETVDGNSTKGCEAYDYESGKCKDTNKPCDTCYANTVGTSGGCGDGCNS